MTADESPQNSPAMVLVPLSLGLQILQRQIGWFWGLTPPLQAVFTPLHRLESSETGFPPCPESGGFRSGYAKPPHSCRPRFESYPWPPVFRRAPLSLPLQTTARCYSPSAKEGCTEAVVSSLKNSKLPPKKSASRNASKPRLVGVKLN
jgi:hypothetical protein